MKCFWRSSESIIVWTLTIMLLCLNTGCKSSRKSAKDKYDKIETVGSEHKVKLKGLEKKLVDEAISWMGTPYKYAGSEKGKGTDCSGMVLRIFEDIAETKIPRNSGKQAEFCEKLKRKEVRPGDLVFFATGRDPSVISHVGIMIDDVRFVHASTKKGVIISEVNTPYYERTFMMYGRVPLSSE